MQAQQLGSKAASVCQSWPLPAICCLRQPRALRALSVAPSPGAAGRRHTPVAVLRGPGAAGIDERGLLGEKKRRKVLGVLKETDVAVVVLDVAKYVGWGCARIF